MVHWYFRPYRSMHANRPASTKRTSNMMGTANAWNLHWTTAPRLVALALVAFIAGVTLGIAGF
jgi:hypothetical protein